MKAAVIYYSLEGNTKLIAEKLSESLGADITELKPVKAYPTGKVSKFFWGGKSATFKEKPELEKYDLNTENYDTFILGTPIWAGTIAPPLRTFLSDNDISKKRIAAFVCCSGGNPQKAFAEIKAISGCDALAAELNLVDPLKNGKNIDEEIKTFTEMLK